ncbi:MAG: SprT family zinc-dependent metalloprotease [Hyphomicrobiaceae bacterium]
MRRNSKPRRPREQNLKVAGIAEPIVVKRHPGARRLTLRVSHTRREIVLTMPNFSNLSEAGRFVSEHMGWLKQRLEAVPEPVGLATGTILPFKGEPHLVCFLGPTRHRRVAWIEGARAAREATREADLMGIPPSRRRPIDRYMPVLYVTGHEEHAPRRLRDWLIDRARETITQRVAFHADRLAVKPRRVVIRDQSSRWGSCSSSRVLSFSWRLVLAPPWVLDYVAAHEVAHLKEMNHGPRFWQTVERTYPRVEEARLWLHRHGVQLHRYGLDF